MTNMNALTYGNVLRAYIRDGLQEPAVAERLRDLPPRQPGRFPAQRPTTLYDELDLIATNVTHTRVLASAAEEINFTLFRLYSPHPGASKAA